MTSQLISGGFYVSRLLRRPEELAEKVVLPDVLLTLSSCLTGLLPDSWALGWASSSEAERLAELEKLGIPSESLPELIRFATRAFDRGELGWPCVWQSLSAARAVKARFAAADASLVILELGVPKDFADELLREPTPLGVGQEGFQKCLKSQTPLEETGVSVGWELLGAEMGGSFHSWLCNGLQDEAFERLGIEPGPFGLLPTQEAARAIITLIEQGLGAEPVPWFPGLLRRFD